MSALARKLADVPIARGPRKGPPPACNIYGEGDLEDFAALIRRRSTGGEEWAAQQTLVDERMKVTQRIKLDLFRYHWSGKCGHWDHVRDAVDALRSEFAA